MRNARARDRNLISTRWPRVRSVRLSEHSADSFRVIPVSGRELLLKISRKSPNETFCPSPGEKSPRRISRAYAEDAHCFCGYTTALRYSSPIFTRC